MSQPTGLFSVRRPREVRPFGIMFIRDFSDSRRLSAQSRTTLVSPSQLLRSRGQAQVLTCAIRLIPLNMHAQTQSTTTSAAPSSQYSSGHLPALTWRIWAHRLCADLCQIQFSQARAQIAKVLRRVISLDHKHLAQRVYRGGAASTLDPPITDHRHINPSSLSSLHLQATQKTRGHGEIEHFKRE